MPTERSTAFGAIMSKAPSPVATPLPPRNFGHIFSIWLKFRGGKGVATGLGAFLMIAPKAVLLSVGIFLVLVLMFRYVSLGSIAAVAAFPNLALLLHEYGNVPLALALMSFASVLIVVKHRANILRLLAGTENRLGSRSA